MGKKSQFIIIKIVVMLLSLLVLAFTAYNIYHYHLRSKQIDPTLVESYRPGLNSNLVRQAYDYLKNK